jgi:hypothetical protein
VRLRDAPDDLFALVGEASEALGLPQEFVEKDFWITEILRSLTRPIDGAYVVFKGGTSLSKAFGLLERFSEDVDILLVADQELGRGAVDRILKELCGRAALDLALSDEQIDFQSSSRGVHRNVRYLYPARAQSNVVKPGALLEMGVRGGPEPRQERVVTSLVASHAVNGLGAHTEEYVEFAAVSVQTLSPERTLFEKLALLHHLGETFPESQDELRRSGRHVYDIARLLNHEATVNAISSTPGLAGQLAEDVCRRGEQWGWPYTPRPADGYGASAIFDPSHGCQETLRGAYELVRALIYGEMPTFDDCQKAVRLHSGIL